MSQWQHTLQTQIYCSSWFMQLRRFLFVKTVDWKEANVNFKNLIHLEYWLIPFLQQLKGHVVYHVIKLFFFFSFFKTYITWTIWKLFKSFYLLRMFDIGANLWQDCSFKPWIFSENFCIILFLFFKVAQARSRIWSSTGRWILYFLLL